METTDAHDDMTAPSAKSSATRIGELFFRSRDYTPIPLIILLLVTAKSSVVSATLGLLFIVFGELIRIYSVAFIGSISRTRKDRTGGTLITKGPFGYVRNPLYVGNFFISFGLALFGANVYVTLLTILLFGVQYYFIVRYEENLLGETFGQTYKTYCQQVPAWVPKRTIRIADLEWPDTFSPALKSERKTLMAIAAILVLLIFVG